MMIGVSERLKKKMVHVQSKNRNDNGIEACS